MANQTGGFGFRQAPTMGSTPATGGQAEYMVKSGLAVGIFQNNPVSLQSAGDTGYLQDASADTMDDGKAGGIDWSTGTSGITLIEGVFNGIFFVNNSTSKPTFANHVLASTTFGTDYNTGSTDGIGFVNDNPMQEYAVKCDDAITQANLLSTFNPTDGAAADRSTDINGQSTVKLDIGTAAATGQFKVVRTANDPENNDNTVANSNVIVMIAPTAAANN